LFLDRVQGEVALDLVATGDFVLRRRDGVIAYALAVVVDDADQGVTEVVRGADLLESTPAQIYLQSRLGLPTPSHAHLPVLTERGGAKLAKSRRSVALDPGRVAAELTRVLRLLGLDPPEALAQASPPEIWGFARAKWSLEHVPRTRSLAL
ncbi:MAG: tRNA glutamyl-Q(34) synthetase GluQRS, partial [Gammaproteobacteria bacterium]|nr:tRNA glutamyl-Q(34) synthetase GluQRS [Gammaproteobacteria bacterium]